MAIATLEGNKTLTRRVSESWLPSQGASFFVRNYASLAYRVCQEIPR